MYYLRNGCLDLMQATRLQKLLNGVSPSTLGDNLTVAAAQLLLQDLKDADTMVSLNYASIYYLCLNENLIMLFRSSLSCIINLVHPRVKKILTEYIDDSQMWKSAADEKVVLGEGLSTCSKELFDNIIDLAKNENNVIQSSLLEITICEKKVELLKSNSFNHQQKSQLLDILNTIFINIKNNASSAITNNNKSETTCYRYFASIMDIVLRSTEINLIDGEHVCKATKEVITDNKRYEESTKKSSAAFGRKIDMILANNEVELSAGEWKKEGAGRALSLLQQTKNIRVNKVLLTKLHQYPLSADEKDGLFCLGVDFTGSQGYIFYAKKFMDAASIAKPLCGLKLPQSVSEISKCYATIDSLFQLKNHNENLLNLLASVVATKQYEDFLKDILYHDDEHDERSFGSPNVLFTPPKKRSMFRG